MIKLSLTFAFLFAVLFCSGQTYQLDKDTSKFKNWPLYVLKLKDQMPLQTTNILVDPMAIDSISIIKNKEAVKLYGKKGKPGVVEIYLRDRKPIVNYDQLLVDFNIPYTSNDLPVFIDSAIAYHPKEGYFSTAAIKWVKVDVEQSTGMKYINIRSTYPINRPKPGQVQIKRKVNN